jgi:hypothetical protein
MQSAGRTSVCYGLMVLGRKRPPLLPGGSAGIPGKEGAELILMGLTSVTGETRACPRFSRPVRDRRRHLHWSLGEAHTWNRTQTSSVWRPRIARPRTDSRRPGVTLFTHASVARAAATWLRHVPHDLARCGCWKLRGESRRRASSQFDKRLGYRGRGGTRRSRRGPE